MRMSADLTPDVLALLKDPALLIPAIAQDAHTGEVLMLAYMNRESLALTIQSGRATYWSRSRNELWEKGATSGNTQGVVSISIDCDGDAILLKVNQHGPACHNGEQSCFHNDISIASHKGE
jgi:phosphoribosyl-AMP cyclohydrolase